MQAVEWRGGEGGLELGEKTTGAWQLGCNALGVAYSERMGGHALAAQCVQQCAPAARCVLHDDTQPVVMQEAVVVPRDVGAVQRSQQLWMRCGCRRCSGTVHDASHAAPAAGVLPVHARQAAAGWCRHEAHLPAVAPLTCASRTASSCSRALRPLSCTCFSAYSRPSCERRASSTAPSAAGAADGSTQGMNHCKAGWNTSPCSPCSQVPRPSSFRMMKSDSWLRGAAATCGSPAAVAAAASAMSSAAAEGERAGGAAGVLPQQVRPSPPRATAAQQGPVRRVRRAGAKRRAPPGALGGSLR